MTATVNHRTSTATRPLTAPVTATTNRPTGTSPKRPARRWIAPVGTAAALCAFGVAALVQNRTSQPAPRAATEHTEALANGRVLQPGLPDGFFQTAPADVTQTSTAGTGQIARPGLPDGHWHLGTEVSDAATGGTGQVARPGSPDGYWQSASDAASAATPHGCKISGPC